MTDNATTRLGAASPVITAVEPGGAATVTVIEPEAFAPIGRLGEWIFAEGARLEMVRPWKGEAIPAFDELGDALVVLGGAMSAHDDETHPWLADLRALLREVVDRGLPAVTICLGAQVAAEALGGRTAVPSPHGGEEGVVELQLTPAGTQDRFFGGVVDEAVRAAVRAGISTADGTRLPVLVSHDDGVVVLPQEATLLASSQNAPVQAWRAGRLLALQHHPESTPARMEYWLSRNAARHLGVVEGEEAAEALADSELPAQAVEVGRSARAEAERVDSVIQAFGRALARRLVEAARGYAAARA